jgi:hypothetical protein
MPLPKVRVSLTPQELELIVEALDSHEYWQLTPQDLRHDGHSLVDDGDDEELDATRVLFRRLEKLHLREVRRADYRKARAISPNPNTDADTRQREGR